MEIIAYCTMDNQGGNGIFAQKCINVRKLAFFWQYIALFELISYIFPTKMPRAFSKTGTNNTKNVKFSWF